MALLGPAGRGLRLTLVPSWSVLRVLCWKNTLFQTSSLLHTKLFQTSSLLHTKLFQTSSLLTQRFQTSSLLHTKRFQTSSLLTQRFQTSSLLQTKRLAALIAAHLSSPLLKPQTPTLSVATRSYAKSKDKKGKEKQVKSSITNEEMNELVDTEQMTERFADIVEALKQDYIKNLTIRSSAGSIETLPVQLDGDEYPLNELALVSRKSPQVVIINASAFPTALPGIMTTIRECGMNLNPQQEGTTIIVPIPKVTREHRETLAKGAKAAFNRCKEQLRDAQNLYLRKLKNKEGKVSEDLIFNAQLKIRELAEEYMQQAEKMMHVKQKDLLQTN